MQIQVHSRQLQKCARNTLNPLPTSAHATSDAESVGLQTAFLRHTKLFILNEDIRHEFENSKASKL
jgi:hypothetical protein